VGKEGVDSVGGVHADIIGKTRADDEQRGANGIVVA
jgi:hypothetical protein